MATLKGRQTATESPPPLAYHRYIRSATIVAALAMVGYLGLVAVSDRALLLDGLGRLHLLQWLALFGLSLFNYAARFGRWHLYLATLGARVTWQQDLQIYIAGFALTVSPGKAGEVVRSVYLREKGVPWSQSLAVLTLERVLDLVAMLMLAALALQVFADYAWAALLVVVSAAAGLFAATRPAVIGWLQQQLPATGRIGTVARGTVAILDHARSLLVPGRLLSGLALGVIAWGAEALGFWLLLDWLGVALEPWHAMGIYAVGMLAGALSFLPGGVGGAEAAMVALVLAGGATMSTAVLATVICRAVTLWFAVVIGIGSLLSLGRR